MKKSKLKKPPINGDIRNLSVHNKPYWEELSKRLLIYANHELEEYFEETISRQYTMPRFRINQLKYQSFVASLRAGRSRNTRIGKWSEVIVQSKMNKKTSELDELYNS